MKKLFLLFLIFQLIVVFNLNSQSQLGSDITSDCLFFGQFVELSGDGSRVATTCMSTDFDTTFVKIYQYNFNNWEEMGSGITLQASITTQSPSLTENGEMVLFSNFEPSFLPNGDDVYAYIYKWDSLNWVQFGESIYLGTDLRESNVTFSTDGTRIAHSYENFLSLSGVNIYQNLTGSWQVIGGTLPYGQQVSFSKNPLRIGIAKGKYTTTGSEEKNIYVYEIIDGTWQLVGNSLSFDGFYSFSSFSMSANGNYFTFVANGRSYVYRLTSDEWVLQSLNPSGPPAEAVDISSDGSRIVLGDPYENQNFGSIKVNDWSGTTWGNIGDEILGVEDTYGFGRDVSLSFNGNVVAGGFTQGIRVYELDPLSVLYEWSENKLIELFPNPVCHDLSIAFKHDQSDVYIRIIDLIGNELFSNSYTNTRGFTIDVSQFLTSGIFFAQLTFPDNRMRTLRFIKAQ